jgi:uncharacterized membrane-anchored protein YjiN (DUF445 family)
MIRYNLELEQKKLDFLKEIAKEKGESVSKIIRDAIDDYVKSYIKEALRMEDGSDLRFTTRIPRPPREDYNE